MGVFMFGINILTDGKTVSIKNTIQNKHSQHTFMAKIIVFINVFKSFAITRITVLKLSSKI